jgi:hypothetical protein
LFIEAAAAAVQLVAHLLRFAIDPPPMTVAATPRRFEVVTFFDDWGEFPHSLDAGGPGHFPRIPASCAAGANPNNPGADRWAHDPSSEIVEVDEVGLAYYQVSFLLFTVTFYANLAHNLTRSP